LLTSGDYVGPTDTAGASPVQGLEIGEGGIDRDSTIVTRLLAWGALQSGQSPDTRYEMSRHDAAVVLELAAGWDPLLT
jgi:hypothetical protein